MMNARIKELMLEAGYASPELASRAKKLAELIIKECINIVECYKIPVGNSRAGEIACDLTYSALEDIRDQFKELM